MIKIINELKDALINKTLLIEALNKESSFTWQEDYPVAVVHESVRIKEKDIVESLRDKELLNSSGFSPNQYTDEMISVLDTSAPQYIKKVSVMCLKGETHTSYIFKEIGFIWVATVPGSTDLNRLLKHYFNDNYDVIQKEDQAIYIGWSDTLKEVNMRYFVCPPN